jgi:hypothetical protein
MVRAMLLAEEFLLLCFDDRTGKKIISSDRIEPAIGGALLAELALMERIGITPHSAGWRRRARVTITDLTPTDDSELDAALTKAAASEGKRVKDLISKLSGRRIAKGLERRLLERLVNSGVLDRTRGKVLGIFPRTTWPIRNPVPEEEVRERVHSALVARLTPTERTVAVIALMQATGLLGKVVRTEDKQALKARAKELTTGDWVAKAVKEAIDEMAAAASG